ncbi:MAG: tetratricopeptide repeat protein [Planctomycetota bacterium]
MSKSAFLLVLCAVAVAQEPDVSLLQRAQEAFDAKRYAEVPPALTRYLKDDPDHAGARALLGHAYYELNEPGKAREELARAVALGRLSSDVLGRLAQIALEEDALPAALNSLRVASLLAPDDSSVQLAAASAAEASGLWKEAENGYLEVLEDHPADAGVRLRLGNLYLKSGQPKKALPELLTAHHMGSTSPALLRTVAELFVQDRDLKSAVAWYRRLLLLDKTAGDDVSLRCARLLEAAGEFAEAAKLAKPLAASKSPEIAGDAELLLGRLAAAAGEPNKALEHWLRAVAAGRGGLEVRGWLGLALHRHQRHQEAIPHLARRLSAGVPDQMLLRALVGCHLELRQPAQARKALLVMIEHFGLDAHARALATSLRRLGTPNGAPPKKQQESHQGEDR